MHSAPNWPNWFSGRLPGRRRPFATSLLLLAALAAPAGAGEPNQSGWRYVVPDGEAAFTRPASQSLALSTERPDDLAEDVAYRGERRWYGQLRYGTPDSTRVAVVVDDRHDGQFDLYIDLNRNRIVQSKERVAGDGRIRQVELPVEIRRGDAAEHHARTVRFRRGLARNAISIATLGYLEGAAEFAGREVRVRRVDATANGFFADGRDRLWMDLDGNGQWDPFREQFPCLAVLPLEGKRFAVRSNAWGTRLEFAEIEGAGTVELKLATLTPKARVRELDVMLIGEDGSAVAVRDVGAQVPVPAGRYAFRSVALVVEHPETGVPWRFVFSRSGSISASVWHAVAKDEQVALDPLGTLAFDLKLAGVDAGLRPGAAVSVQPKLTTAEGLLINSCTYGRDDDAAGGSIRLVTSDGTVLAQEHSGFV